MIYHASQSKMISDETRPIRPDLYHFPCGATTVPFRIFFETQMELLDGRSFA
jgi:hypothetical protein